MKKLICLIIALSLLIVSVGCGRTQANNRGEENENIVEVPQTEITEDPPAPTIISPERNETPDTTIPQPNIQPNWPNNLCGVLPDISIHTYVPGNFHYESSVTNNGTEIIFHSYGPRGGSIHNLNLATGKITIDQYGISQNYLEFMPSDNGYIECLNSFQQGHQTHQHYAQSNTDVANLQIIINFIESINTETLSTQALADFYIYTLTGGGRSYYETSVTGNSSTITLRYRGRYSTTASYIFSTNTRELIVDNVEAPQSHQVLIPSDNNYVNLVNAMITKVNLHKAATNNYQEKANLQTVSDYLAQTIAP